MINIKDVNIRNSSESEIPPTSNINIRNSSGVIVRCAEEKDLTAIEHLTAENNEKFEGDIENMFVAEKDVEVVGYISYDPIVKEDKWLGKYYDTKNVVVKDEYIGEGIVSMLIEYLTNFAGDKGMNVRFKH